jgi:hypothetical protein
MIIDYLGYTLQRRHGCGIVVFHDGNIAHTSPGYDAAIRWIEAKEGRTGIARVLPHVSAVQSPEDPDHAA